MLEPVDASVLDEQLAYYRARAPEYDDWFERRGRYDRGGEATRVWREELVAVRSWLAALELAGREVAELASGTGIWTEQLLSLGATVTAVDAAPEMLAALRQRVPGDRLTTIEADLFSWVAPTRYDAVVSCFFVSHVPDERLDAFASMIAMSLRTGGQVFVLDGLREHSSTARDHELPEERNQTMLRRLDDGATYRIVKRFRSDESLAEAFERHGLQVRVHRTPTYFQVLVGRLAEPSSG